MKSKFILRGAALASLMVSALVAEPTVGPYVQAHGGQGGARNRMLNDLELTTITRAEEGFWHQANALTKARSELAKASLQLPANSAAVAAKAQAVADAELAYALSRADAFAKVKVQLKATTAPKIEAIVRAMSEPAGTGTLGGGGRGGAQPPAAPAAAGRGAAGN